MDPNRQLYLHLLKKCLTCTIYGDELLMRFRLFRMWEGASLYRKIRFKIVSRFLESKGLKLIQPVSTDCPIIAHTKIGMKRLEHLQFCCEEILKANIPGDFMEAGIYRGGAVIFMRGVLKAYGDTKRIVWAADSFAGLPPPNSEKYPVDQDDPHHTFEEMQVSLEEVKASFEKYNLLDSQVQFLKGWFRDTLPTAPIQKLSVLRLDGDMYESTRDALVNLYPKLSMGGFLIEDDYHLLKGPHAAIDDYRGAHQITDEIQSIDGNAIYWRKTKGIAG